MYKNSCKKCFKKLVNRPQLTLEQYFLGNACVSEKENIALTVVLDVFRYLICQSKLEKKLCNESVFFANMKYALILTCKSSQIIDNLLNNSNIIFVLGDGETRGNVIRP
jgi:hypothetical protein